MKPLKLMLFLFTVLGTLMTSAQIFTVTCEHGDTFYLDQPKLFTVKVEGYDSSKILVAASLPGVLEGDDGRYIINLTKYHQGDVISISVFVDKGDGMYLIGEKPFKVLRKHD